MNQRHLIYGRHPVLEALKAGKSFEKILIQQDARSDELKTIRQLATLHKIPLQLVPARRLHLITAKNHQGVIGYLSLLPYYKVEDIMLKAYDEGRSPLFLILDHITDVRNFGAIARTAELTGVDALIVPEKGSALIHADAIKASAGALHHMHLCKTSSLRQTADYLHLNGIRLLAADEKADKKVFEMDFVPPVALILGAEGKGISASLNEKADERFAIPMVGKTGSFNVSVAAGIILYEVMRQRANAPYS
ncbi:MAG: 23S rRNA (guanosine(2251)-2'-O)-methyltransferase RlmB [Chitinophagales bacterium]|nr:MAG: 23S rRNA (guanosine(2251)-2'-O)-methyltransferase RlmB [Chitinophagales bacterium]